MTDRAPGRAFDSTDLQVIRKICTRLDGIPLAIELASARANVLAPAEIMSRLATYFAVDRLDEHGHQLLAAVQWSYDQLDPEARLLFDRLSAFSGGFTANAAEAVCGNDDLPDIIAPLSRLVDDGLLLVDATSGGSRLRLLGILRDFSARRLDLGGQTDLIRHRHREYHHQLITSAAERFNGEAEARVWVELGLAWSEIRTTVNGLLNDGSLDQAGDMLASLFYFAGYSINQEVADWALTFCAHPAATDSAYFTSVAGTAAFGLFGRAQLKASYELARRGLEADPTDPNGFCHLSGVIATINLGLQDESKALLDHWFDLGTAQSTHARIWAHGWMAVWQAWFKKSPDAITHGEISLGLAEELGSPSARAAANWIFATACALEHPYLALASLEDGLRLADEISPRHLIGQLILGARTDLTIRVGDLRKAIDQCLQALEDAVRYDWLISASHLLGSAAVVLVDAEQPHIAAKLLGAMRAVGHVPRARAITAVEEALGPRSAPMQTLGAHLSLRDAADLAIEHLRSLREAPDLSPAIATWLP